MEGFSGVAVIVVAVEVLLSVFGMFARMQDLHFQCFDAGFGRRLAGPSIKCDYARKLKGEIQWLVHLGRIK